MWEADWDALDEIWVQWEAAEVGSDEEADLASQFEARFEDSSNGWEEEYMGLYELQCGRRQMKAVRKLSTKTPRALV